LETRHYTILPLPESMSSFGKKWSKLTSIGRVVREVERDRKQTRPARWALLVDGHHR
jgi:hypothetical protein